MSRATATAEQAVAAWMSDIAAQSDGNAHYGIEQAVRTYGHVQLPAQALAVADQLVASTGNDSDPSKKAFAEYMKIKALHWNGRDTEAITLASTFNQAYVSSTRARIQDIRISAQLYASALHLRVGNPLIGDSILAVIETAHPNQYRDWVRFYRNIQNPSQ